MHFFFLNILVGGKQQDVKRGGKMDRADFQLEKAGQSISLFGTPYGFNGLNIAKVSHV